MKKLLALVSGRDLKGNPKTKEQILAEFKSQMKAKGITLKPGQKKDSLAEKLAREKSWKEEDKAMLSAMQKGADERPLTR